MSLLTSKKIFPFPLISSSKYFLIHVPFRDLLKDCISIILRPPFELSLITRENEGQRGRLLVQALGYVNSTKVIYRYSLEWMSVF